MHHDTDIVRDRRRPFAATLCLLSLVLSQSVMPVMAHDVCSRCPSDLNGDAWVDGADLGFLLANWSQPGPADINHDGITDGADLGFLLSKWGTCDTGCITPGNMVFSATPVPLAQFNLPGPVVLNGSITVAGSDGAGVIDAGLPGGGPAIMLQFSPGMVQLNTAGLSMVVESPGMPASVVVVNGTPTPVGAVLDQFKASVMSGAPVNTWQPTSRATLALLALVSTGPWSCNVGFVLSQPGGLAGQGFMCKATAYAVAGLIAGLAVAGCAALTAGCAAGSVVTIGGMAVPCTLLIGLCAGGAFAGTTEAYEAVLCLWGD